MSLFKILKGDSSRVSMDITPFHDGYAYFTPDDGGFYIDSEDNGSQSRIRINPKSRVINCTLQASGWISGSQSVLVSGVTVDTNGSASLPASITDEQYRAASNACLTVTGQNIGSITITAKGTVPSIDIPIVVTLID